MPSAAAIIMAPSPTGLISFRWARLNSMCFGLRPSGLLIIRSATNAPTQAIATFDARFTKPLVLPGKVGLFLVAKDGSPRTGEIYVGDAAGSPAYLVGSFTSR